MSISARIGLVALVAVMLPVAPALAANTKTVYGQNAQVGHLAGDPYTGPMNGTMSSVSAQFNTALGNVTCNQSTSNGTITDSGAIDGVVNGNISTNTYTNNGGACPSTLAGNPNCAITSNNLPWPFTITTPVASLVFTLFTPSLTFNCGGLACTYGAASITGTASFNPAGISFNVSVPRTAGGFFCPASGTLQVVYSVTGKDDVGGTIDVTLVVF